VIDDDAGADAPHFTDAATDAGLPPEPACPACGCETISSGVPGARRTLHADGEHPIWLVTEEGYVGVRSNRVALLDRDGTERASHAPPFGRYYIGGARTGRSVVVWTSTEIEVLEPALDLVRTIAFRGPCFMGVVLACGQLACIDRTTITYDLETGASRLGTAPLDATAVDLWSTGRLVPVPDRHAVLFLGWPEPRYLRLLDGSIASTASSPSGVRAVGPNLAMMDSGEVRSLEGCGEADATRCFARVGSVGHDVDYAAWGSDGSFYVRRGFVLERFEPSTGALSTVAVDFPGTRLAYDPWSHSVISVDYATVEVVPVP
jgi:hypothetical protein